MESSKDTEISLLKEILKWTKFSGLQQLRQIFNQTLKDENMKTAYQLSDGTVGLVEVGDQVDIKKDTLAKHWKNWARMGLGEYISVKGGERFKRSFDLEEIGIEVQLPNSKSSKIKTEKQKPLESEVSLTEFQKESESTWTQGVDTQENKPTS